MKTKKLERFKSAKACGTAIGLSDLDMELIRQKKRLIEKLKEERLNRKMSQAKLAEEVGWKLEVNNLPLQGWNQDRYPK